MESPDLPPLVLIEWLDSIGHRRPHRCVSIGFLVQDDAHAKVLAPNLGASDGDGQFDQASGLTTIPTASVQRILRVSGSAALLCSLASLCRDAASEPMRQAS